jgi:hypothetical protein
MRISRPVKFILVFVVLALVVSTCIRRSRFRIRVETPREYPALAMRITEAGENLWEIPRKAVSVGSGQKSYVLRLELLRAKRIEVHPGAAESGDEVVVRSERLRSGDLVLADPGSIEEGAAISVNGLDAKHLIELTIEAGEAAARNRDLRESARFISRGYCDEWGFDFHLMTAFLAKAYRQFDHPQVELCSAPDISIDGPGALIQAAVKVQATRKGRNNYLLGGPQNSNKLLVRMEKLDSGWKVAQIKGLEPLGFEEKFMKLLGAEVGLPLSEQEKREKKQFCMPCRQSMADRFGGGG